MDVTSASTVAVITTRKYGEAYLCATTIIESMIPNEGLEIPFMYPMGAPNRLVPVMRKNSSL